MVAIQFGFDARAVTDAKETVDVAARFSPDAFVSSASLSGMHGVRIAMVILAMNPACRVLQYSWNVKTARRAAHILAKGRHFEIWQYPLHPKEWLEWLRNEPPDRSESA